MKVIGITGGIGSGKTTFAGFLAEYGVEVVDVDQLANRLTEKEPSIQRGIEKTFGPEMFDAQGKLNRKKLAQKAFSSWKQAKRLNRLFRPHLCRSIQRAISDAQQRQRSCIVFDMAVLFETRLNRLFDTIVTIVSSRTNRLQRIMTVRGWCEDDVRIRMASQLDDEVKMQKSDLVIVNDGDLDHLRKHAFCFFETTIRE